ncbi:hypothetical protein ASD04_06990 [Devosia sp. Root436]|uniref:hypothetical protein n=1 Tax=Devosia sp. Root436 TaxID=1736537 RepID=UPI0006F6F5B9|nr:hypothetical protein [Devosia sp. Root436]KQX40368.1 hypothetical protein ASD04_06990 [Devosia sp. Root436]
MSKSDPRQLDLLDYLKYDAHKEGYPLRQRLIADGFAHDYSLQLNRGLMHDDGEGVVNSRLCRSPVFYECVDGHERVVLRHHKLAFQPLPTALLNKGYTLEWAAPSHRHTMDGQRMHAADLATDKHLAELVRTAYLTTRERVYDAIASNLSHILSAKNARRLMVWMQETDPRHEPSDRSAAVLATGMLLISSGNFVQFDDRKYSVRARAWAALHALEDGWVKRKGHLLNVTAEGRARQLETA